MEVIVMIVLSAIQTVMNVALLLLDVVRIVKENRESRK